MASAELRLIRRRIRSVGSTMKITRAMELIAASRIVRARQRVAANRPYTEKLNDVVRRGAAASGGIRHGLLDARETQTAGVLVVSSDRGLAGSYNTNVIRRAEHWLDELSAAGTGFRVYCVGRKAQSYLRFRGHQVERTFLGVTDTPGYGDARAIANVLMKDFAEGIIDSLEVFFTRYSRGASARMMGRRPVLVNRTRTGPVPSASGASPKGNVWLHQSLGSGLRRTTCQSVRTGFHVFPPSVE